MGFVDFTKLSFALSSLAQPFNQMGSVPEHVFVILSQRKAYAGRFQKETAGKRTGPMTKWSPLRLLFTRLEIVFVKISSFTKRTKVVPKVFQRPFYERSRMVLHITRRLLHQLLASVLSSRVRFQILGSSYHFN